MAYDYELEVKYQDENADTITRSKYYRVLEMFNGNSIRNKDKGTATIEISSETELTQKELENLLGDDIPILSFNEA